MNIAVPTTSHHEWRRYHSVAMNGDFPSRRVTDLIHARFLPTLHQSLHHGLSKGIDPPGAVSP
jgi:hypothetical protein